MLAAASAIISKNSNGKQQAMDVEMFTDSVNPIRKVVGMLSDMKGELERETEQEGELFEKAMCACEGGEKDLNKVIADSTQEISRLNSEIEEESAQQASVTQALKEHYANKASASADLQKATDIRTKEAAVYSKESKMQKFSIGALGKAIPQLEGGASAASLMQSDDDFSQLRRVIEVTHYVTSEEREQVLAFMDDGLGDSEVGGMREPSAPVSEIVGVLKNMKDTMAKDYAEQTESEKANAAGYGQLKTAKEQEISVASEAIISKEKQAGTLAVSLSEAKAALEDAEKELSSAQEYLKTLVTHCDTTKSTRDLRKKMRADEIAAISEAIKILTDDDALEIFKKAVPSASLITSKRKTFDALMQFNKLGSSKKKSLLQTVTGADSTEAQTLFTEGRKAMRHPGLFRARNAIEKINKQHPSRELSLLLTTIGNEMRAVTNQRQEPSTDEAGAKYAGDAEKVVSNMVDDMVHVLHDEDVDDEHKKDWCFNETDVMTRVQEEKTLLEENLNSSIAVMTEDLGALNAEIKELEDTIYEQDQTVLKATKQRKEEHEEFVATFQAIDTSLRLLDRAATKLNRFYNPEAQKAKEDAVKKAAAEAAGYGLLQTSTKVSVQSHSTKKASGSKVDPIELPDTPVEYEKKESGGVIGLMDKLKSEMKADQKEDQVDEKYAARDYTELMKDQKVMRAQNVKSLHTKQAQAADLEDRINKDTELQEFTLKELAALKVYLRQLDIECTFIMKNFENRHDARVGEEVGLEGAETIVTHEDPPNYKNTEKKFEEEHSHKQVDEHFPHDTLDDALR
eukprot:gnl/MRDRNA2_/MRDRNA2_89480_c0_seq1.p1 gnl/MRDRNA2_/MRDRNA2_89480_c0~~gnl/MRDRNA2_/MRDRNA2_89480_c0_seq1.p1  ORF type:complete len:844 (+),score=270.19 gnl/MRDRNA2_/MRDRNA2_89480_c0_seq1:136-2532(+)